MTTAYQFAGYEKRKISVCDMIEGLRALLLRHGEITTTMVKKDKNLPSLYLYNKLFGSTENAYLIAGYDIHKHSNDELLNFLKETLSKNRRLSARIIDADPILPSSATIRYRFGSLDNAYEKAGYKRYNMSSSEMLSCMKNLLRKHKKLTANIIDDCPITPSAYILAKQFGNLGDAFRAAGYTPVVKTNDELLKGLKRLLDNKGVLTRKLIDQDKSIAHSATYQLRFGGLGKAYKLIGYKREKMVNADLVDGLKRIYKTHGKITHRLIDAEPSIPSREYYVRRFGSLLNAYKYAGFKGHYLSDREMLRKLKKLLKKKGRLSKSIITEEKDMPSGKAYTKRFGGIRNAYELIGYK
tara:strand:+ start:76427 stop:77488 length:1062 start_codon:yes stop_codon:yes gene_type:complete